jgi:hypothetical protein
MKFINFETVPPENRADWLDAQFGVDHDELGLGEADARRLHYATLTKVLRHLLEEGQGQQYGLKLVNGELMISHALRVRLYRDLRSRVAAPEPGPARHRAPNKAAQALAFVNEWVQARHTLGATAPA